MHLAGRIDTYLRRSLIARFIPQLRHRMPSLYGLARKLVNRIIPLPSRHGLARHQARAVDRFCSLVPVSAADSVVLEIGSDPRGQVLRELMSRGATATVGINPAFEVHEPDPAVLKALPQSCILGVGDARDIQFPDTHFSAVFSISVFEHLLDFEQCLKSIWRVLRPGGHVYADFGPIWSCSIGHHVCAFGDGQEARHFKPSTNPVQNHAHLLRTAAELQAELQDHVSPNLLRAILAWIYEGTEVNRLFYEDYVRYFDASPFEVLLHETDVEHVDRKTLQELQQRHPGYRRFDVRNARVLLHKPVVP